MDRPDFRVHGAEIDFERENWMVRRKTRRQSERA